MTTMMPSRPPASRPQPPGRPAPGPSAQRPTPNIDPVRVLRRYMIALMFSVVVGSMLGAGAFVLLDKNLSYYSASAVFEIRPGLSSSMEVSSGTLDDESTVSRIAQTEAVIIKSRQVLREAARDFDVEKTDWYKDYIDETGVFDIEAAVDDLEEEVGAGLIRGSNMFRVTWSAENKDDTMLIVNKIAEEYDRARKALENQELEDNIRAFDNQVSERNETIEILDEEIANFIKKQGITSLDDPRYSGAALKVRDLTERLGEAESQLSLARSTEQQLKLKLQGTPYFTDEDYRMADGEITVMQANQQLLAVKTDLAEAREKYHSENQQVKSLEIRERKARQVRDDERLSVMTRNVDAQLRVQQDAVESFTALINELDKQLENAETRLKDLTASQASYEAMETRRKFHEASRDAEMQLVNEAQLMKLRTDADRVRLRERAETPREKAFPKPEIIIPLGAFLCLGLTLGFVFLREVTDQRVKSASDLAVIPHADVIGAIPDLGEDPTSSKSAELVVRRHPSSVLAESFRQATSPILRAIDERGHQSIVMLSGLPGSGTTTAVSNIALTLDGAGKRVCVVDANFRRPGLSKILGFEPELPGLGDVLAGDIGADAAINYTEGGIGVITAGTPGNRLFERLGIRKVDELLLELRDQFDIVLFDAPPAVVAGDAIVLADKVDAAVLIARANREQRGLVARLIRQLGAARADLIGVVLNRPLVTAGGYLKKNYVAMARYAAGASK